MLVTFAKMPHLSPIKWVEIILIDSSIILQVALLVSSIKVYRVRRTRPFALIVGACACYVIPKVTWFVFFFTRGFFWPCKMPLHQTYSSPWWQFPVDQIAVILFLVLMIVALRSFLREPEATENPDR
jgi:hypothetical protein